MKRMMSLAVVVLALACSAATPPPPPRDDLELVPPQYRHIPRATSESGIEPPKAIKRVEPIVPASLRISGRQAAAAIEPVIDVNGRVTAIWYLSGHREWADAAAQALWRWQFEPAKQDGNPVPVRFVLTVRFRGSG